MTKSGREVLGNLVHIKANLHRRQMRLRWNDGIAIALECEVCDCAGLTSTRLHVLPWYIAKVKQKVQSSLEPPGIENGRLSQYVRMHSKAIYRTAGHSLSTHGSPGHNLGSSSPEGPRATRQGPSHHPSSRIPYTCGMPITHWQKTAIASSS